MPLELYARLWGAWMSVEKERERVKMKMSKKRECVRVSACLCARGCVRVGGNERVCVCAWRWVLRDESQQKNR